MKEEMTMDKTKAFNSENTDATLSFDPFVILIDLYKSIALLLAIMILVFVGAYIYVDTSYVPEYKTSTTLVITTRDSSSTVYSNLSATSNIATVFEALLNSSILQSKVLEEVGLDSFDGRIYASRISETNLLTVSVTDNDPRVSFLVIKALIENHGIVTEDVIGDVVVEVLESASVPMSPSNSANALRKAAKAAILAFAVSAALVCVHSFLNDTIRSRREAEKKLDCYCLGEIGHEKKPKVRKLFGRKNKSGILITNPTVSLSFTESIRKICRKTEQALEHGRVVMVTSVTENEGKSTIAVNLALAMAKKHDRVLLIDMDLRKPACFKLLEKQVGAVDTAAILASSADFGRAVQKEPITGLYVLLSKNAANKAENLLSHNAVERLLEEAKKYFKYIIIDMPPMSAAMDSEIVMEHADASILVVRQNGIKTSVAAKAVDVLHAGKAKLIGCVVNNVVTSSSFFNGREKRHSYDAYSRYSRYSGSGKSSSKG